VGEFADRVDSMRVRAVSPDGTISAELYDRDQLSMTFRPGFYDQCSDQDLERRLGALASLLWVARTREYNAIYSELTGDHSTGESPAVSDTDRAWRAERDNVEAYGSSSDGRVRVRAIGLRDWQVSVQPGTARRLDEAQFAAAAAEAAGELVRDQSARMVELSHKYYGSEQ
jgi:hypothetical protein